jgi:hypothetical protein
MTEEQPDMPSFQGSSLDREGRALVERPWRPLGSERRALPLPGT